MTRISPAKNLFIDILDTVLFEQTIFLSSVLLFWYPKKFRLDIKLSLDIYLVLFFIIHVQISSIKIVSFLKRLNKGI